MLHASGEVTVDSTHVMDAVLDLAACTRTRQAQRQNSSPKSIPSMNLRNALFDRDDIKRMEI
jgi:hypothetical protein